ncbi:MAG: Zn-dependent exopeptidase M28 [Nocardioidaceae bacterium]|nr:Zn-dependent exopeptidase M28 [Nocardioidaceae bacterium]
MLTLVAALGCTTEQETRPDVADRTGSDSSGQRTPGGSGAEPTSTPAGTSSATTGATPSSPPTTSPTATKTTTTPQRPTRFSSAAVLHSVRHLAGRIGPREATTQSFDQAASWAETRLRRLGYVVQGQRFRVPAGVSWGEPVPAGPTRNVVATTPGTSLREPHVLVGAHLDTVPQAPGAEDNASGVAVLLELARLAEEQPTRVPVVFVLFSAEEPRGDGDDMHHFGSRAYVARMSPSQRVHLTAMVSLDRVGTGSVVPLCTGGVSPPRVRRQLAAAGDQVRVPTTECSDNQSSDHWSFEKAGLAAARVGSTPYAEYHSEQDVPGVVGRPQLDQVGRLMWKWLTTR